MNRSIIVAVIAAAAIIGGVAPVVSRAAELYLDPASGKYAPGVAFPVVVRVNTQNQCINAAEVEIAYPKGIIEPVAASDGDSIFSIWVKEPTIYADYGLVSFVGGLPGGYCGRIAGDPSLSNRLATIYFAFSTSTVPASSTPPRTAAITFMSGTRVTLNDGAGTIAPLALANASFTEITAGHYAQINSWQAAIQNDTTPPEPFTVQVYRDPSLFNGQWFAVFSTVDKQTGIDHYEVAEVSSSTANEPQNEWDWKRAISPYLIQDQSMKSVIAVRAIDAAGNIRFEEWTPTSTPATAPVNPIFPLIAIIGVVGFVILQIIMRLL